MDDDQQDTALARLKPYADKIIGQVFGPDLTVDKLQAAYNEKLEQAGAALTDISDYTRANPWMALAAAFGTGLVIGRLKSAGKRKITYVRKVRPEEIG